MAYAALPALAAVDPVAAVEPSLTADIATAAEQARCQNDILSRASEDEAGMAVACLSANAPAAAAAAAAASPPETVSPAATTAARAAAAAANAIGSMRHVCEVCGEGEGIYRCARCLRRSCSLRCYKQHERESVMAAAVGAEKVAAASATTACARANQAAAAAARAAAGAASARGKASVSSAAAEEAAAAAAAGTAVWNVSEEIVTFNASATGTETRAAACPLVRPRVHAVPLQQFDEDQLVRDLRLLDGAARAVESAARVWRSEAEEALHREAKKKKRAFCSPQQLRSACAQRQIRFFFCPPAFSRRRLNTTRPVYRAEQQQQQRVQQEEEEQQREPVQQQEDRAKPEEPREGEEQSLCQENERRPATVQQQQQPKRRDQLQPQREQGEEHLLEEEGGKRKKQQQQSSTKQEKGGEDQTKEDEEEEEQGQTEQSEEQQKMAHQRRTHQQQEDGETERKTLLPEHSRRVNAAACAGAAVRQKQLLIEWRLVLRFPGGATQRVLPHVNENLPLEEVVQRVFAQERAAAAAAKHRKQQQQQEQSLLRGSLRREANEAAAANRDPAVTAGKQTAATPRRDAATAAPASPCPAEEDKTTTTPMSPATAAPDTSKQAKLVEILAPETGAATASTCIAALGSASSSASPAYAADAGCTVAADYPAGVRAVPAPAAHFSTTLTACSSVIPAAASADKTCISAPPAADTATTSSAAVHAPALRTIGNVCDSVEESSVVGESSVAATSGSAGAGASPTSVEEASPLVVYMKAKELVFLLPLLGVRKPPQSSPSLSGVPVSPLFAATHLPPSASLSSSSPTAGGSTSCCVADAVIVPSARRADAGVEARTDDNTFDSAPGRQQGANEHGQQELQQNEEAEGNCEKNRGASSAFRPLVRRCSGKMTVREALRNSVVVEFPEFLVVLPEELQQYHCVGDRTGELPVLPYCHASAFTAAHNPSDVLFSTGDWPAAVVGTPATTDSAPAACPGRAAAIVLAEHKLHLQAQQPASNSSSENCETEEDGVETSSEEEGGVRADDDNEEKNTEANEEATWRGRGSFKCFPNRGGRQVQQHSTRRGCVNASSSSASATGAAAGCRAASFTHPLMSRRGGRGTGCPGRRLFRGAIGRGTALPRENSQQQGRTMTDATEEPSQLLQCQQPQLDHQNKQPLQHHWSQQQQQQRQSWQKQQQQQQRHHPQCRQQERKLSQKEQSASDRGSNASPASRRGSSRGRAFRGGKRGRFC